MGVNWVAALWGFAEAVLFFIVPDVWLSIAGREKLKRGFVASLYCLGGALAGGSLVFAIGAGPRAATASAIIENIPAVGPRMMEWVSDELETDGPWAILRGPLSGTPYKTYAVQAAGLEIGFWSFLLVSIPARLLRFLAVVVFCHYALKIVSKRIPRVDPIVILITGWTVFYLFYFLMIDG